MRRFGQMFGVLVWLTASTAWAAEQEPVTFDMQAWRVWLYGVRAEGVEKGVRPAILDEALAGIDPIPRGDRTRPPAT